MATKKKETREERIRRRIRDELDEQGVLLIRLGTFIFENTHSDDEQHAKWLGDRIRDLQNIRVYLRSRS